MSKSIYDPESIDLASLRQALTVPEEEEATVIIQIRNPVTGAWSDPVAIT